MAFITPTTTATTFRNPTAFCNSPQIAWAVGRQKKNQTEEKAKVVAAVWGTNVLECRTSHLAARMIRRKVFGRTSIFWRLMVGCAENWKIIYFSEASIPPSVHFAIHLFLQIILALNLQCGMELNEFHPPISSDDLCLLSFFFFFFFYVWGIALTQGKE